MIIFYRFNSLCEIHRLVPFFRNTGAVYSERAVNAWGLVKPVCVCNMSLSAGLTWGGHRFPQLRMAVCKRNVPAKAHDQ